MSEARGSKVVREAIEMVKVWLYLCTDILIA